MLSLYYFVYRCKKMLTVTICFSILVADLVCFNKNNRKKINF